VTPRPLILAVLLLLAGCASAEVRARCPDWKVSCGCYCGPGGAWSGVGPPRPKPTVEDFLERQYPTKVAIVDGRPMHPSTGKPINCELMAPFEERLEDLKNPIGALFKHGMWGDHAMFEIRGWQGYAFGIHGGHVRQGIAMSRACRTPEAPATTPPNQPAPAEED
jgi:hypothetical protein